MIEKAPRPDPSTRSALAGLVRRHDHDRFLTTLFVPPERRHDLLALYAFNYEIAKTREVVSEPILGQIRLHWWREGLDAAYGGMPMARHEVLGPLAKAIERHNLAHVHFEHLIDAREADLQNEPPATVQALEAYAEATSGCLIWLALEILGERGDAAVRAGRSIGIAHALAGLLRAIPFHARGRRSYLPHDLSEAAGLRVTHDMFELRTTPALREVVSAVASVAVKHLQEGRAFRPAIARAAIPALLPAIAAEADLARLKRARYDPYEPRLSLPDPIRSWRLAFAALSGRY